MARAGRRSRGDAQEQEEEEEEEEEGNTSEYDEHDGHNDDDDDDEAMHGAATGNGVGMSSSQAWSLYASHALSTWNARTYEFAAIVFTAAAYPGSLVASSLRGIATTLAAVALSSSLGRCIDGSSSRLAPLLATIAASRLSVTATCLAWFVLLSAAALPRVDTPFPPAVRHGLFGLVVALGVVERLSGAGNAICMERDWAVCVAGPPGHAYDLTRLNAAMRRIDLVCKLLAPIALSLLVGALGVRGGVLLVAGMGVLSCGVEVCCATSVWRADVRLRLPRDRGSGASDDDDEDNEEAVAPGRGILQRYVQDLRAYFSSRAWMPSMALSLLHLSVLSYSATFITHLLALGFSLNLITLARAAGSVVEIASTLVTPLGVEYLGSVSRHAVHRRSEEGLLDGQDLDSPGAETSRKTETGLQRLGLWGITWQLLNLIPVVLVLYSLATPSSTPQSSLLPRLSSTKAPPPLAIALPLFAFLSLSRLGLWVFDLTTTQLTQTLVPAASRSTFSGVENAFVNLFELGNYLAAILLSRPDDFAWLALGSLLAVVVAAAVYAAWVRGVRGHLVHWEHVGKGCAPCGRKG